MSAVEVIYTPGHTDDKGDTASTIGLAQEVLAERGCAATRSEFLEAIARRGETDVSQSKSAAGYCGR